MRYECRRCRQRFSDEAEYLRHIQQHVKDAATKEPKEATKARPGRNPATGEEITIPAKKAHDVLKARMRFL